MPSFTATSRWSLVSLVLATAVLASYAQATDHPADARQAELTQVIQQGMARHQVSGASVALVDGYQIVWQQGWGLQRHGDDSPVTADTRFQAASISKPITAIAALRLVEQGRLKLDQDVNLQLRSWKIPDSPLLAGRPITLRHLLSHSAGLSVHGFAGYVAGQSVPTLAQVLDGAAPANNQPVRVQLKPGYAFRYSGGGYSVVQQLMCDVTGERFVERMRREVLTPAGMTHSTYEQPLSDGLAGQAAVGHHKQFKPLEGNYRTHPEMAAAGLWTTAGDLARVVIDVSQSYISGQGKLLSQASAREMLTRQNARCGLGFFVQGEGDQLRFDHGGANEGYRCQLIGYPATGQGLVLMTNSDTGGELIADAVRAAARIYRWPSATAGAGP